MIADAQALAGFLNITKQSTFFLDDGSLRQLLTQAQDRVQRGLSQAYLIDGAGELKTRGEKSYLFDFVRPSDEDLVRAQAGEVVLIQLGEQPVPRADPS